MVKDISKHEFLIPSDVKGNFKPYCAPQLSEVNNQAIDLPYFWCRGKECFHNNLEKQTLSETNDWHSYSLYHLSRDYWVSKTSCNHSRQ